MRDCQAKRGDSREKEIPENIFQLFLKKGLTNAILSVIIYRSFKEAMLERRCGGIGRRPGLKIP